MICEIADLFCGAGGTSTGALQALNLLGRKTRITAINHWQTAVDTHSVNHPDARHLCTNVDDVDPRRLYKPGELFLLWASPECTHHSRARGGKPMSDQSRATAHCVTRWAEALLPPFIFVENVKEFADWGPIGSNGRPLKSKRGHTFRAWVGMLESLGYRVDWRILNAADYGEPTTRERLFVYAVRGRRQIVWPDRTHAPLQEVSRLKSEGDLFGLKLRPWATARDEVIDWNLLGRWLDEMPGKAKYGGLPLSPKTLRRIHAGLWKFGLKPFTHGAGGPAYAAKPRSVDLPMNTVLCESRTAIAQPFLVEMRGTDKKQLECSAKSVSEPIGTITAGGIHHSVVEPFIIPIDHTGRGAVISNSVDVPLSTVTTEARHGFVQPYLVPTAHGDGHDRCASIDLPLATVNGNRGDMALLEPHLLPQQSEGRLRPVSEPVPTVATAGAIALVEPYLVKFYNTANACSVDEPLDTVTTKERFALVQPAVSINGAMYRIRFRWRMLQLHELQKAQGFPAEYRFVGTKTDGVKQVGNAVPPGLARALVLAAVSQSSDISSFFPEKISAPNARSAPTSAAA